MSHNEITKSVAFGSGLTRAVVAGSIIGQESPRMVPGWAMSAGDMGRVKIVLRIAK